MSDPRLPPELERIVFVEALRTNGLNPVNLLLVAKRVKEWLVPIVFEVVFIHGLRFYPARFDSLSQFEEYGPYIHRLLLSTRPNLPCLNSCLSYCPNITDLALWWPNPPIELDSLTKLSTLTRLSINLNFLVHELGGLAPQAPKFPNITHLDTIGTLFSDRLENHFLLLANHFPFLTHIAGLWSEQHIDHTLRNFKGIKVVVSWTSGLTDDSPGFGEPNDDRVVFLSIRNKLRGWENANRRREQGMWEFVDDILADRVMEKARKGAEIRD